MAAGFFAYSRLNKEAGSKIANADCGLQSAESGGEAEGDCRQDARQHVGGGERKKGSGWRGRFYQLTTFTDWSVTD
jgi:hypothetical protein